jgi:hypothetical protein
MLNGLKSVQKNIEMHLSDIARRWLLSLDYHHSWKKSREKRGNIVRASNRVLYGYIVTCDLWFFVLLLGS